MKKKKILFKQLMNWCDICWQVKSKSNKTVTRWKLWIEMWKIKSCIELTCLSFSAKTECGKLFKLMHTKLLLISTVIYSYFFSCYWWIWSDFDRNYWFSSFLNSQSNWKENPIFIWYTLWFSLTVHLPNKRLVNRNSLIHTIHFNFWTNRFCFVCHLLSF